VAVPPPHLCELAPIGRSYADSLYRPFCPPNSRWLSRNVRTQTDTSFRPSRPIACARRRPEADRIPALIVSRTSALAVSRERQSRMSFSRFSLVRSWRAIFFTSSSSAFVSFGSGRVRMSKIASSSSVNPSFRWRCSSSFIAWTKAVSSSNRRSTSLLPALYRSMRLFSRSNRSARVGLRLARSRARSSACPRRISVAVLFCPRANNSANLSK
jgi:hypothetical protein